MTFFFGAISIYTIGSLSAGIPLWLQLGITAVLLAVAYGLSRTRYHVVAVWLGLGALVLPVYLIVLINVPTETAMIMSTFLWLTLPLLLGWVLLPRRDLIIFSLLVALPPFLLPLVSPVVTLGDVAQMASFIIVVALLANLGANHQRRVEEDRRQETLAINQELETSKVLLSRRSQSMETAYAISRQLSTILEQERLAVEVVEQLGAAFGYYHAHIYLFDDAGEKLLMVGGTGEAGAQMLGRGHSIPRGRGLVGRAAQTNAPVLVSDVSQEAGWLPNPLLPETKSELAVPVATGDQVLGVIDVQHDITDGLGQDDVDLIQLIASQVAIAIQNVALFSETEQARVEVEAQARRLTREGWERFLDAVERGEHIGYTYDQSGVTPLDEPLPVAADAQTLAVPIQVLEEHVGSLHLEGGESRSWTQEDSELVMDVAGQVTRQIENLRLLADADRFRTEAEQAIRRLTREGWSAIQGQAYPGYVYDGREVKPISSTGDDPSGFAEQVEEFTYDIKVRDEAIGQFGIAGQAHLSEQDQALVTEISQQLSAHIEGLRLQRQTQAALSETEALFSISSLASRSAYTQDIWDDTLEYLLELTGFQCGLISLYDDDICRLALVAQRELPQALETKLIQDGFDNTLCDYVYQERKVISLDDMSEDSPVDASGLIKLGLHTYFGMPIQVGGEIFGTLCCFGGKEQVLKESLEFLRVTGEQIGIAIEKANLLERTQQQAEQESLINIISQQIQSTTNVDDALQVAIRELGRALDAKWTKVQFG